MPKSHRIRTQVGVDKYINVNLEQDWESLEVLSLKILASDVYTRMCADYGVVVGRVFVNNGFGLPNARVSVFVPLEPADELNPVISELYPYKTITETNEDGYRYNLLPKLPSYNGHASTGSFPNVADSLMDDNYIEVYDKYYRFTVKTNESGDFMIFGVPTGTQTIVMDVDLSDIGCFSLAPQDLIQQGLATESQVNGSTFKSSTNLRELPQIKNLVFDVNVAPFWGDEELCQLGITRVDFDLTKQANINIQPTSIFMGSIISTTDDDALKVGCKPKNDTGNLCELVSGPGEIQAIRHTINTDKKGNPILEQYQIEEEGKVIDGDGTYLINVPMNLDYVFTNEFGEQVLSDDPTKGIPTKGKYRFKFKWQNDEGLQNSFQRANFLVPNIKEYGWDTSGNDPFDLANTTGTFSYTIPIGQTTGSTIIQSYAFDVGLSLEIEPTNTSSFVIYLNGVLYTGTLYSIPFNMGDTIKIVGTANNTTAVQNFVFTTYPKQLFDVYKSYAFSLDWDDYANPQEAIDCEDTFYEFKYNKVYTTAMFLDRYKNGIGRARHLGIKEIDNRSCKSTVNTFPVNDIIRNFDFIFFVFNILINVLTFPILVLLFVAHLIALLWPIIKILLLFLGPYIIYQGVSAGIDLVYYITSLGDFAPIGGPVISIGTILQIIAQAAKALILVAAGVWFTAWYTKFFIDSLNDGKVDNFPRIGLPMIAYDDCTSCDCDCGNASLDDDVDASTIQQEQQAIQNELNTQNGGVDYELTVSQPNSIIAAVNSPGSYAVEHPNLLNNEDGDPKFSPCSSLQDLIGDEDITSDVAVRASLDFARMISGYDVLSTTDTYAYTSNDSYLLHAPQPFLWGANKSSGADERYFAFPNTVTFSQKLNDFNTRDKYFYKDVSSPLGSGVNRIKTYINPSVNNNVNDFIEDQVVVILMNAGTIGSIGAGGICTFQDPNFTATTTPNRYVNLTGATENQFSNNAITGSTLIGNVPITISYADPSNLSNVISKPFIISSPPVSQLPIVGNPNAEQSYLQYPTDMEYFQLITGITAGDLYSIATTTTGFFPATYLGHDMGYLTPNCDNVTFTQRSVPNVIETMANWENLEVCIFVRGVDPFTARQTIKYDLSTIFGNPSNPVIVEGQYCLNQPIQRLSVDPIKPLSHNTSTNTVNNLYFPSFTFTPDPTQYSAFTSTLPYYYLSTDDSPISSSYNPIPPGGWYTNAASTNPLQTTTLFNGQSISPTASYMVGGSYLRWDISTNAPLFPAFLLTNNGSQNSQKTQYYNLNYSHSFIGAGGKLTALYSPAYYRQLPTTTTVNFNDSSRIIMRSDRIPTSTTTQNGTAANTGYGLHQNDNFSVYTLNGVLSPPTLSAGGDLANGAIFDLDPITSGLTSTLACEGMVPLECYTGSGTNVGVVPAGQCSVPANRMINGCYCLLNQKYVKEYGADARLFLEWKVRFTLNFAACRGVFAQVFQNNWLNGALYMFNFNKTTTYSTPTDPVYNYCTDVIVYNDLTNGFYYRSSPWKESTQQFVGKDSPATPMFGNLFKFPGLGYNFKQIQFPTTITDLGPRDSFINEICCNGEGGFGSYYADQLKSSSYQDNANIIQLGFLSRILNQGVRQRIIPISAGGSSSEGQGIVQFFNSTRGGYRIDGDWAQMLSINSEWKVLPFITENVPSNEYIYFGDNGATNPEDIKPVLGLFFQTPLANLRYRKIESPGIETYSFSPLIEQKFGYPKTQLVPNYKWSLKQSTPQTNIFGTENNNWYTNTISGGFYSKKYQDLDFTTLGEKYITSTTNLGYIVNYDSNGDPDPSIVGVVQGQPIGSPDSQAAGTGEQQAIVAGAPYHFYFGLNNGKTAVDRFYKLYVATAEEI